LSDIGAAATRPLGRPIVMVNLLESQMPQQVDFAHERDLTLSEIARRIGL
jgi:hypothetical protein